MFWETHECVDSFGNKVNRESMKHLLEHAHELVADDKSAHALSSAQHSVEAHALNLSKSSLGEPGGEKVEVDEGWRERDPVLPTSTGAPPDS